MSDKRELEEIEEEMSKSYDSLSQNLINESKPHSASFSLNFFTDIDAAIPKKKFYFKATSAN